MSLQRRMLFRDARVGSGSLLLVLVTLNHLTTGKAPTREELGVAGQQTIGSMNGGLKETTGKRRMQDIRSTSLRNDSSAPSSSPLFRVSCGHTRHARLQRIRIDWPSRHGIVNKARTSERRNCRIMSKNYNQIWQNPRMQLMLLSEWMPG